MTDNASTDGTGRDTRLAEPPCGPEAALLRASARVMVVDDEPNIVEALRYLFERDGWRFAKSDDGRDLIARLRTEGCDVLILDIMLPGTSGLDLLRDLRAQPDLADLPVIMLSARGAARAAEASLQAGASCFIAKPFSNAQILAAARDLVGAV